MTASILVDCPYCAAKSAAFRICEQAYSRAEINTWYSLCECGVCKKQIMAKFERKDLAQGKGPFEDGRNGPVLDQYRLKFVSPSRSFYQIPEFLPENVLIPLEEAEKAFASGLFSAAGSCYRKALERALKAIDPELNGMLNARIRKLEENGKIPIALVELLDQVRMFGNASMHEDEINPTKEDCSAAREFCTLFLTYSFTLPTKVAAANAKAAKSKE